MIARILVASALFPVLLLIFPCDSRALENGFIYSGQIGSFKPRSEAVRMVSAMREQGLDAFYKKVRLPEKGWYYRVYLGNYDSAAEARRELVRLKKRNVIREFYIHRIDGNRFQEEGSGEDAGPKAADYAQPRMPATGAVLPAAKREDIADRAAVTALVKPKREKTEETGEGLSSARGEKSADFYYILGIACDSGGRYDSALKNYSRAIEKEPNFAAAYNKRGIIRLKKGQGDLAIADHNRAVAIDPNNGEFRFNRGIGYRLTGQFDLAISDFREACRSGNGPACEALKRLAGREALP